MTRTATVNYHVHKAERQAFHLDAEGVPGRLIAPELAPTEVTLQDMRSLVPPATFATDAVEVLHRPSQVKEFAGPDWQTVYDAELHGILSDMFGAREVVVFDHTLRKDAPGATRQPARNVHSDYSPEGAGQRLRDLLGAEMAAEWSRGHYAFINLWRPVGYPINSAPLGFVRPATVAPSDWVTLDLVYPDRVGQIMGLAANPDHGWMFYSRMSPEDIAVFNIYDNRGQPSIAHSALEMVEDPGISLPRQSLESRTLVRY